MKSISIVIPVYNEQDNVTPLFYEIKETCEKYNYEYELIFVDDGSKDKTSEIIKKLSPVKLIRFRKNFGQTAAMDAGIKNASKQYIITMDGDRQNDPADIPYLIEHLENNELDMVAGWRKSRKDSIFKRFVSRGANFLRFLLIHDGIHDSGCTLKIFRRECFDNLTFYGEMHRFIPALLKIRGFTVGEIVVNHRPRHAGVTKYNWRRALKGFIDMISIWFWNKYAVRPLHFLGSLGLTSIFCGLISGIATIAEYLKGQSMSRTALPLLTAFFMLFGIQLFISGLMADILLKSYYETTKNESYSIKEIIENN